MATITVQTPPIQYPASVAADAADITFETTATSYDYPCTGREIVILEGTADETVTFTSQVDDKNRTQDITAYVVDTGDIAIFGPFPKDGWADSSGNMNFTVSASTMKVAVVQLPSIR